MNAFRVDLSVSCGRGCGLAIAGSDSVAVIVVDTNVWSETLQPVPDQNISDLVWANAGRCTDRRSSRRDSPSVSNCCRTCTSGQLAGHVDAMVGSPAQSWA